MTIVFTGVEEIPLREVLRANFFEQNTTSEYEKARFTADGVAVVLYNSGKLVVQTKDEDKYEKLFFGLGKLQPQKIKKEVQQKDITEYAAAIGSDETLKGDSFGGLIVAGAYFTKKEEEKLERMGVTDSKALTDKKIAVLAVELLAEYGDRFVVQSLLPEQYNDGTNDMGQTGLMNKLHKFVGATLQEKFGSEIVHIVDKYPGCTVGDIIETKAESRYIVVAAASIVARYQGLVQFEMLSKWAGFTLPKGSTHVGDALVKLNMQEKSLKRYAKLHFSNVKKIVED